MGRGWKIAREGDVVTAVFDGHLTTAEGKRSALAMVEAIAGEPAQLVFDVRRMSGYDSGARRAWVDALGPLRPRIRGIRLVGGNRIVRMGASVLGMLIGVPITGAAEPPRAAPPGP